MTWISKIKFPPPFWFQVVFFIFFSLQSEYLFSTHPYSFFNAQKIKQESFSDSLLSSDGHFKIYFDQSGEHAVPAKDADSNGTPDWVESIAQAFERSYQGEVLQLGYKPPPDMSAGNPYNIFVQNLVNYFARTVPINLDSNKAVNKNLSSYIIFDNDFQGLNYHIHGDSAIKIIAAHEFFHAIQLGYVFRQKDDFFLELSAVWMESQVFPEIPNYRYFFKYFFSSPDIPLSGVSYTIPNIIKHIYGRSIWAFYIEQRFGKDAIRQIIEKMVDVDALHAMDRFFAGKNSSFAQEFMNFSAWNFFTGERSIPGYGYAFAAELPTMPVATDTIFEFIADRIHAGHFQTAGYYLFHASHSGTIKFTFLADKPEIWRALVIGFDSGIQFEKLIGAENVVFLPPVSQNSSLLIIAGNVDINPDETTIFFKQKKAVCNFSLKLQTENATSNFKIRSFSPNPFHEKIEFYFSQTQGSPINIEVFNILGQKVFFDKIDSQSESWLWRASSNEFSLATGIYFFRFQYKGTIRQVKAVKF